MPSLRLDHVGVQVRNLDKAIRDFEKLFGYRPVTRPVENTRHGVRGVFLESPGSIPIKLITPVDPAAGDQKYGLHHLAFITDDLEGSITELRVNGARLISPAQPGEMFDDNPIAFLFASGLNFEVVTTNQWRGRIDAGEEPSGTPPR